MILDNLFDSLISNNKSDESAESRPAASKPLADIYSISDSDNDMPVAAPPPKKAPAAGKRKLLGAAATNKKPAKAANNDSDSDDIFTKKVHICHDFI